MSTDAYIRGLKLSAENIAARPRPPPAPETRTRGADSSTDATYGFVPAARATTGGSAAVVAGSVLSFVDGLERQQIEDVLYSVQLAQRGASGAHDRYTEVSLWYRKYRETLERVGWTTEQLTFAQSRQDQGALRMDKAALAVIAEIAVGNQLTMLTKAIGALESLADDDNAIRLFDFHALRQVNGNFQIGAVRKTDQGALSMALGAFHFSDADVQRKFLFFSWGERQVSFWTAAAKLTLNTTQYAQHRDAVRTRLGAETPQFIAELPLG